MQWTNASGVYTKSADTDRDAVTSLVPFPANGILRLQLRKAADEVRACLFGSWDQRSCFEIGVTGTDIVIRKVTFVTTTSNVAGPVAHGLTAGLGYTMDVRLENRTIKTYLNGVLKLTYTVPDNDSLVNYRAYGFVSSVSGAVVLSATVGQLVPSVVTRPKSLWWVAGGILYACFDGVTAREIARGVSKETGNVQLVEHKSLLIVIDGQKIRTVDPVNLTVTETTAAAGTIPGSGGTAGVTDLYLAVNHWSRLGGVSQADPNNYQASALNTSDDWDTGAEQVGRAYTLVTARATLSGQVIRGLISADANRLTVGCVSQMWQLLGDPARGQILFEQRSATVGISGPSSMIQVDNDKIMFHGPQGIYTMTGGDSPTPISESVLSKYIQFAPSDRELYTVHMTRDTSRKGVLICLTNSAGSSVHFWYDERAGGFAAGEGGFFPLTFPSGRQPTASIYYDGELLIGCEDGYIRKFDDTVTDDDGVAIQSYMALERVDTPNQTGDAKLEWMQMVLGRNSGPVKARVWKARSPEEAFSLTARTFAFDRTFSYGDGARTKAAVGRSVVIELYADSGRWLLERAQVRNSETVAPTRARYLPSSDPPRVCQPAGTIGPGSPSGSGSGFGSGPGSGGSGLGSGSGSGSGSGTGTVITGSGASSGVFEA